MISDQNGQKVLLNKSSSTYDPILFNISVSCACVNIHLLDFWNAKCLAYLIIAKRLFWPCGDCEKWSVRASGAKNQSSCLNYIELTTTFSTATISTLEKRLPLEYREVQKLCQKWPTFVIYFSKDFLSNITQFFYKAH